MRIYKGIVNAIFAIALMAMFSVGAMAMPLPDTPPQVDDTPASHEEAPEPTTTPDQATEAKALHGERRLMPEQKISADKLSDEDDLSEVGSIFLIGAAIWYVVVIIGITGGRHEKRSK